MYIYKWLKYKYQKKHRYLDAYIQDLIVSNCENDFKPYKIELISARRTKNALELNCFKFVYEGLTYELKDHKLKIINE